MSEEITVIQFIERYTAAHPDENHLTIRAKVYKWAETGHLPTYRVPNDRGVLVTTENPETFAAPFGPGPVPPGEGLRVSQVARMLGMKRPTVYHWLRKAGKAGGRVPLELVEEWKQKLGK